MADVFTPTQAAMLKILSDGLPHTREELHKCCGPSSLKTIQMHLSSIRKKLRPHGEDIVYVVVSRRGCYQHVRLLVSPYTAYSYALG